VVVAVALAIILLGIPLYFLRRPSAPERSVEAHDAGALPAPKKATRGLVRSRLEVDAGVKAPRVRLGSVQRIKCSASPKVRGNEGSMCDALPVFEEALKKSILAQVDCTPQSGEAGTVNFVLNIDFKAQRFSVFPGASGSWKGPLAKRASQCVARDLPPFKWASIPHQYRFYTIAILATYSAPAVNSLVPTFE
jgi:hypothetical protein